MVFLNGSMAYSAALYVAESFLAAGCGYFLQRTASLLLGTPGDGAPAGRPGPAPTAPGGGRRGGSHPSPPGSWCCPSPSSPSGGSPWGGSPWCSWCCTAPGWGASAAGRCPGWPPGVILGAVHRRALLPLRGLWLGRADGRGFRPHGQAGGGPGLYRVPRGGLPAGGLWGHPGAHRGHRGGCRHPCCTWPCPAAGD